MLIALLVVAALSTSAALTALAGLRSARRDNRVLREKVAASEYADANRRLNAKGPR